LGELEAFNGGAVLTGGLGADLGDDFEIGLALALTAGDGNGFTADLAAGLAANLLAVLATGLAVPLLAGFGAGLEAGLTAGLAAAFVPALGAGLAGNLGADLGIGFGVDLAAALTTAFVLVAGATDLPAATFFATAFLTGILLTGVSSRRWLYPFGLWRRLRRAVFARRGL
jgi:hypothetical protein